MWATQKKIQKWEKTTGPNESRDVGLGLSLGSTPREESARWGLWVPVLDALLVLHIPQGQCVLRSIALEVQLC